jgi:hypothetical protein
MQMNFQPRSGHTSDRSDEVNEVENMLFVGGGNYQQASRAGTATGWQTGPPVQKTRSLQVQRCELFRLWVASTKADSFCGSVRSTTA